MRMMLQALVILVVWAFATLAPTLYQSSGPTSIASLISTRIEWGLLAAPAVLGGAVLLLRWDRLGLTWPARLSEFALPWPSLVCAALMGLASIMAGLPPAGALALVAFNTFFVGVSEELMFRGVLLRGLVEQLSFWVSFWVSSLLFGGVHLLNGLITGDFSSAAVQAGSAFLSGVFFLAVRLRTASLYPSILVHWTWDLAVITLGLSMAAPAQSPHGDMTTGTGAAAVALSLPFALYGLYLMRKGRAACPGFERR